MVAKAIETVYRGYRFRSRLEARWAVFFDAIELPWLYELEGFELEDGTYYLPDFYLPDWNLYVEIKPFYDDKYYDLMWDFSMQVGSILLLYSLDEEEPWDGAIFCSALWDESDIAIVAQVKFERRAIDKKIVLVNYSNFMPSKKFPGHKLKNNMDYVIHTKEQEEIGISFKKSMIWLDSAYKKAKQARFEHGQTPEVY